LANIDDDGKDVAKSRQNVITYIACMQLAEIAYHLGNNSEGQSWLKRAIDIFPSHPSALTSYVSHLSNDELSLEDQKILITALEKNPFFTKHWEVYLKLLSNSGNLQESIAFAKACQLSLSRVQFADKTTIDIFNRYLTNVSQVF
jgi:tetratricopeptide (TPR) repeat protein